MIVEEINKVIKGSDRLPILLDVFYNNTVVHAPLLIFCHGYKGFKDWGAWNLFAKTFAASGIAVLKFNFSHNGGTIDQPIDFPDLEAFGHNNYTKELEDLNQVLDWVETTYAKHPNIDVSNIILVGHSRGGGIVTLKAAEDSRIKKLVSLAGVSDFKSRFPKGSNLDAWKSTGVRFVMNGRTKQQMPHYYQFYEDFMANASRLTIQLAAKSLKIPHLIIHGDADTSVDLKEAFALYKWHPEAQLVILEGANHVFGSHHPWNFSELPLYLQQIHSKITHFINNLY
jgi:dipeptidyl aminopeptidase/acylaminoacyl peptidase